MANNRNSLGSIWSSLTFRVLLLLTLTIAPIGAIAVFQTSRLTDTLSERANDGVLAATLKAFASERTALERAAGAGDALSRVVPPQSTSETTCHATISDLMSGEAGYRFLGLFTADGVRCSDGALPNDVSALVAENASFDGESAFVGYAATSELTVVGEPVVEGTKTLHYVLLAVGTSPFALSEPANGFSPEAMVLLTREGDIVRASGPIAVVDPTLPAEATNTTLPERAGQVFSSAGRDGENRVYSVVPVYRDEFFALAIWQPSIAVLPGAGAVIAPWLFPIFMWLATLTISYIAINRVVVRHVRHLGMHMRRFARNKLVPPEEMAERTPIEFSEINKNFRAMANEIVQDQAELENAVHEKTLLLREVHHRVKNNLQLIASIMNMQIRRSGSKETGAVLRRLQDRVLGLASIHRQMYAANALDRVPADDVVGSILEQVVRFPSDDAVDFSQDLARIELIQDQAVPLALLTAEAVTNAVENLETNAAGDRKLEVVFAAQDARTVELKIRNTIDEARHSAESTVAHIEQGLGTQLIEAFARQLEGTVKTHVQEGVFEFSIAFEPLEQVKGGDGDGQAPDTDGSEPGFPQASAASAST